MNRWQGDPFTSAVMLIPTVLSLVSATMAAAAASGAEAPIQAGTRPHGGSLGESLAASWPMALVVIGCVMLIAAGVAVQHLALRPKRGSRNGTGATGQTGEAREAEG